ncbi:hypothetical protein DFJ58DRAFT_427975 [Suillus subalutaceus]|uniref:uncharacterized protein n=1 Tax=Suillus subalutaceus TaxID=48586 RepID=UPI001B867F05|nr:uncharacterized protein DFJ58DRAFT_427975 [Suillus subalutaceus]KAG1851076.1 hypothetical protein DFJ58DRAFT_427975 [Suillus subalutaceus]
MTLVSNDPSWWPLINVNIIFSYFIVAASVGVSKTKYKRTADILMVFSALMFGQEVELIWRQRWSLMTFLYLIVCYVGIGYAVMYNLISLPTVLMTDAVSLIVSDGLYVMADIVNVLLGVIMITRLHVIYQQSRKMLIFLIVIFLAIRIASVVMAAITMMQISGEEFVLYGTYQCMFDYRGDSIFFISMTWILATVWEVLVLCLAVWIYVKHFHELRQHSTRDVLSDSFMVLMKTHVSYFASFLAVSCFQISYLSPMFLADPYSLGSQIYVGVTQIFQFVGLFVLGPRLILGVREHYAELVANSDTASAMTLVAFQERVHVSTSSSV